MRRREFLTFLSGTAASWPLAARGQPKAARLGVLLFSSSDPQLPTIQDRLRELDYVLGKNLLATQRDGEGSYERLPQFAAELVAEKPDLLLALALSESRPDALYVVSSRHTVLNIPRIAEFAKANRIPLAGGWGAWARAGGLLSFGPNTNEMARRAAEYVDKILKGAKPADLPVQQPTKFELMINAKAAREMGIEVSPTLLARADEVIE